MMQDVTPSIIHPIEDISESNYQWKSMGILTNSAVCIQLWEPNQKLSEAVGASQPPQSNHFLPQI